MSNYRQQSSGALGNLTTCPTCYDTISVLYTGQGGETTACCETGGGGSEPYSTIVFVAQGRTFTTAPMFYNETDLQVAAQNGFYTENVAVGSRDVRELTTDQGGNASLSFSVACDTCNISVNNIKESSATVGLNTAYDACCGNDQPSSYRLPYNTTFLTADKIYASNDTTLSTPLTGFFYSINDGKVKQFNGASPAGTAANCATCFETLTGIRYSNTEAEDVCCDVTATGTYFVAQGETFATANTLYTNEQLTTIAQNGFYSND